MSISLSILLYVYLALVAVFIIFSIFNIYHLLRFAQFTALTATITALYLIISFLIIFASWTYIQQIDWRTSIGVFSGQPDNLFKP